MQKLKKMLKVKSNSKINLVGRLKSRKSIAY